LQEIKPRAILERDESNTAGDVNPVIAKMSEETGY
jgi:hypothetical protein